MTDIDRLDDLLPGIRSFLSDDLAREFLSEESENKRVLFLERLEVLSLIEEVNQTPTPQSSDKTQILKNLSYQRNRYSTPPLSYSVDDSGEYEEPSMLALATSMEENDEDDTSGTDNENDIYESKAVQEIDLPKRAVASRRFSMVSFPSSPWTLAGQLFYRSKPARWMRLQLCVLTDSRFQGFKNTYNSHPVLNIFLPGYTAIYAERDSGKVFVIKLTHPVHDGYVLAANSEREALQWVNEINQCTQRGVSDISKVNCRMCVATSTEPETPDSGFSAQVSSGSEGGSGDGVVIRCSNTMPVTVTSQAAKPVPEAAFVRSSGILSSMRRKVVSLRKGRNSNRKCMSTVMACDFTPADDAIISGVATIRVPGSTLWHERWCQLRPYRLEAYPLDASRQDFTLSLDPSQKIKLGISNDKKHNSALRLYTDTLPDVLQFEVADKIVMGNWIRGFIQALGIITTTPSDSSLYWIPVGSPGAPCPPPALPQRSTGPSCRVSRLEINDDPIYDEVCPPSSSTPVASSANENSQSMTSQSSDSRLTAPLPLTPTEPGIFHLVIPPPSRNLLGLPLPPVPSHTLTRPQSKAKPATTQTNERSSVLPRSMSARARVENVENAVSINQMKRASVLSVPNRELIMFADEAPDEDDYHDLVPPSPSELESSEPSPSLTSIKQQPVRHIGCSLADLFARSAAEEVGSINRNKIFGSIDIGKDRYSGDESRSRNNEGDINLPGRSMPGSKSVQQLSQSHLIGTTRSISLEDSGKNTSPPKRGSFELALDDIENVKSEISSLRRERLLLKSNSIDKSEEIAAVDTKIERNQAVIQNIESKLNQKHKLPSLFPAALSVPSKASWSNI